MDCKKSLAVITGGASGMGLSTAAYLLTQGTKVCIIDLDQTALTRAIRDYPGLLALQADVSDSIALTSAITQATTHFKQPIQIAVHCAGIAPAKKILGKTGPMALSDFSHVIQINLIGNFNLIRLAAESMMNNQPNLEGERGIIINTASIAAFDGQIGQVAYSASKGGIVAMTLPAARELAAHGIRVMTIAPGLIETPLLQNLPEPVQSSLQAQVPFPKRFGKTSEFSSLVAEIIRNPLLNGEVIRLDGALRMPS